MTLYLTAVPSGIGTGISPNDVLNVGIGTTRPLDNVNLTVGAVGSSGTSALSSQCKVCRYRNYCNNLTVSGFSTVVGNFDINNLHLV